MTRPTHRWRRVGGIVAAALVATLALGGCSASDNPTGYPEPGSADGAKAPPAGGVADEGAPNAPTDEQTKGDPAQLEPQDRALIYTGSVTVTATDVVKAAADAIAVATAVDGIVSADQRTLDADRSSIVLIFRVPSAKFASTLDTLAKLGVEESREVQTQDVTEAVVDLDARLKTQQASVDRVRVLLARAETISEITALESELARREADLDSLKQRRAKLAGLVALSTITLNLRGPAAPNTVVEDETGFVAGLKGGWKGFLASVKVVLTVIGFLLPWAVAIGVPLWLLMWVLRRGRARRPAPAAGYSAVPPPSRAFIPPPAPPIAPPVAQTPPAGPPAPDGPDQPERPTPPATQS